MTNQETDFVIENYLGVHVLSADSVLRPNIKNMLSVTWGGGYVILVRKNFFSVFVFLFVCFWFGFISITAYALTDSTQKKYSPHPHKHTHTHPHAHPKTWMRGRPHTPAHMHNALIKKIVIDSDTVFFQLNVFVKICKTSVLSWHDPVWLTGH